MNGNIFQLGQLQQAGANAALARANRATDAASTAKTDIAARKAAEEFEAIFIAQMMAPMFEGIQTDGPFGGGHSEQIYRGMQIEEIGKAIAKNNGIGIADAVYREILKAQESLG